MRIIFTLFIFSMFLVRLAHAQDLSNVKDFDGNLLAGKMCQGSFKAAGGHVNDNSLGAYRLYFVKKDNTLAATLERKYGLHAHQTPDTKQPFDKLGEVVDLKVDGNRITFANQLKTEFTLTFAEGVLTGELDPTKGGRFTTKAVLNLRCI